MDFSGYGAGKVQWIYCNTSRENYHTAFARERALAKPELLIRSANLSPHAFNLVAGHEMPDGGFAAWREGVAA